MKIFTKGASGIQDFFVPFAQRIPKKLFAACMVLGMLFTTTAFSQSLIISDYVLFSGNGTVPGGVSTVPPSPGYAVQTGSSTTITGGSVGSYVLVKSTGTFSAANVNSGGKVILANSATIANRITAANSPVVAGTVLQAGSGLSVGGNIEVNGNIVLGGGTVSGTITRSPGSSYSGGGTIVTGGSVTGSPSLPVLPA